jgi:hypothetical protein
VQLEYIKTLSQAYVIDNGLYEGSNIITEDELTENFYNTIKILRSDHPSLYESIIDSNIYEQQRIFKTYFDLSFENYTDLSEFNLETPDDLEVIEEIGGAGGALLTLVYAVLGVLGTIGKTIISSHFIIVFAIIMLWPGARRTISRAGIKSVTMIFKILTNVGKKASKFGDTTRMAYSIIHNNANKCLLKCDYTPAKAGPTDYLYQMPQGNMLRDIGRIFMSIKKEDKLVCIRTCYLETLEDSVKLAATMYFQCLQNTGDLSKLPLERDFSMYQKLIVKTSINRSCTSFMDVFHDTLESYDTSLRLIYKNEPAKRKTYKLKLMDDIYGMQKKSSTSSSSGRHTNNKSNWKPTKKY